MNEQYEIECYTVAVATVYGDMEIEARWYGGYGVNIYFGGKEVDYYSRMELFKDKNEFEKSFEEYIQDWLKQNEENDEENS